MPVHAHVLSLYVKIPLTKRMSNITLKSCVPCLTQVLDAAADGYVRGEGVFALKMSPFNGTDPSSKPATPSPLAILLGSATNQDGRSSSLTAPSGPAQQEVILSALTASGVEPHIVSSLSMHGTGEQHTHLSMNSFEIYIMFSQSYSHIYF